MAGKVDTVCFDKTGTLTFEGLSMMALRPVACAAAASTAAGDDDDSAAFEEEVAADCVGVFCELDAPPASQRESLALCMAACQAVRLLETPTGVEMARKPPRPHPPARIPAHDDCITQSLHHRLTHPAPAPRWATPSR